MDLDFERGSSAEPKGHALIYFRTPQDPSAVLASYLIIPPVPMNLARYMPPMFAAGMPAQGVQALGAVPLPPVPEAFADGRGALARLAEARGDDLLDGGTLDPEDAQRGLLLVSEAARQYQQLYEDYLRRLPAPELEEAGTVDVSDVLFSLMTERQRLGELAKLAGKLRYAVEGRDARQVAETAREMEALGKHVPEKYRVGEVIAAAQEPGQRGERLSQLYIDRCYRLAEEDYAGLRQIEEEIKKLRP
ncbi:MAG: hypothetical protein M1401_05965 [Chloroflexi bacterium]|nr:hypothetical protein [Chloroflexota bacterium]